MLEALDWTFIENISLFGGITGTWVVLRLARRSYQHSLSVTPQLNVKVDLFCRVSGVMSIHKVDWYLIQSIKDVVVYILLALFGTAYCIEIAMQIDVEEKLFSWKAGIKGNHIRRWTRGILNPESRVLEKSNKLCVFLVTQYQKDLVCMS